MTERSRDLLVDAEDFLGAAEDLLRTGRLSKVCFNAQQAAELSIKALLHRLGVEKRGNSVTELLKEAGKHMEEVKRFEDYARILDQYYIPTRYANAFAEGPAKDKFTERQAVEAVRMAREILEWVRRYVLP